ncbi:GPCR, family 2, secretin-like-containing protein [Strongyloides ratti]|uniref:GPCR, family 2, secretin-like-containing protein n=1 Tax=Strongyloides ratti TaxID=34506 RepID=A0A090KUE8_STRRB|nr:GPCR, family 2, secretin-like-containing protein [Strongyloides ratti]CEF59495.1 GPCR, family 2, secretin-like-containing protein [Strongyloides ratti]
MFYDGIYEFVYKIVLGIGIITILVAIVIISVSFQKFQGIYVFILGLTYLDCLLSFSLIYTGFYGLLVATYNNSGDLLLPEECLYTALFLLIWIIYDIGTFLILFFQSIDRLVHSITSIWHEKYQNYIMTKWSFIFCLFLSILPLIPLIQYPIEISANNSFTISINCHEKDVFGKKYFDILSGFRFYGPILNLLVIFFVLIIHIVRMNIKELNFANTAFDKDTNLITLMITLRTLFQIMIYGIFTLIIPSSLMNDYFFRCTQCFVFIIFHFFYNYFWLEKYKKAFTKTFQKYIKDNTRTWQSADDPPINFMNKSRNSFSSMFGSWYSTTGNIIGEAGVPKVDEYHKNISISFYCEEDVVVFEDKKDLGYERF